MPSVAAERQENDRFEEDVRLIAKNLFPKASNSSTRNLLGRERDGIFNDGETFHIFEATVSRRKQKVEDDIKKSVRLVSDLRREHQESNVKIWIVTRDPPTADQEDAAREGRKRARCPVEILSYQELYTRLFDARALLDVRKNYPFGSVRNLSDNSHHVPESSYVQVGFTNRTTQSPVSPDELTFAFTEGGFRGVVLGDYGAGKSMALRHVYNGAVSAFQRRVIRRFPVYLNLRDHFGQSDPAEALMRHARKIGIDFNRLIAAWRAGFVDLFLDGFDELSPAQFSTEVRNLRLARRAAAELVLKFVEESAASSSVLLAGRRHYFDSLAEMRTALGLSPQVNVYDLSEFTDRQINEFLERQGLAALIPLWLPRRPLLIGYLAANGMLGGLAGEAIDSPADGWDFLLDQICEREIRQIPGSPIEPQSLRLLLEKLATRCRMLEGGRGPLSAKDIIETYEAIFNQPADARTQTLLLRLPGLATVPGQEEAREFLDDDFVDACRAGDARRFVVFPYDDAYAFSSIIVEGGNVLTDFLKREVQALSARQVSAALIAASSKGFDIFGLDLIKGMIESETSLVDGSASISDIYVRDLEVFSDVNLAGVRFEDCWLENLTLSFSDSGLIVQNLPIFHNCVVETLHGLSKNGDLPSEKFTGSTAVERFLGIAITNAGLLANDDLAVPVAVLLTILKKTFFQAGGGRKEAAFFRGLDHRAKAYVPEIMRLLERHGFLEKSGRAGSDIWLAKKDKLADARAMRDSPFSSQHPVMEAARALSI